jgi:hydroxymethylpyrimidine pyrophosphatase-like HAD family hydrolase
MGKPYEIELRNLKQTYEWALKVPIEKLCHFINASHDVPLVAVGSGGSLTAACMAALLHQRVGMMSKGVTPLDFISTEKTIQDTSVLIMSAGGRNSDILSAFRFAATSEPRQLMALCMRTKSPLAILSKKFRYSSLLDFDLPSGKDGFLATNSLLAFIVILIRAYKESLGEEYTFQQNLPNIHENYEEFKILAHPLLEKNTLVVLYGGWGFPVAIDAESKFTEAALSNIQIADYRNFAHGRHHWLAKRGAETGVIALITPDERRIAERTLDLIPENIPSLQITTDKTGPTGSLELLVKMLCLVYLVGTVRGIDPGMPGVPPFGRRIYNLRLSLNSEHKLHHGMDQKERVAIIRKNKSSSLANMKIEDLEYWRKAYRTYLQRIERTAFGSVVFDYDGTLCDPDERYSGLSNEIGQELVRLLRGGIVLGIATGRGKSVRTDLQRSIPKKHWEKVLIGYYNGSDIASLDDSNHPDKTSPPHTSLQLIKDSLESNQQFHRLAKYECRPKQITVEPVNAAFWRKPRAILLNIVAKTKLAGIQVLESSHSIDVLAPGVSKRDLILACEEVAKKIGNPGVALCVGDRGEWPGNDYEFLSSPYSLSVHTVSADSESCWNLSQAGHRGVQATMEYLRCISISSNNVFTFSLKKKDVK